MAQIGNNVSGEQCHLIDLTIFNRLSWFSLDCSWEFSKYSKTCTYRNALGIKFYSGLDRFRFRKGFCFWKGTNNDNLYMRVIIQDVLSVGLQMIGDACMLINWYNERRGIFVNSGISPFKYQSKRRSCVFDTEVIILQQIYFVTILF